MPLPNRKASDIMNSPFISNLLESTFEDFSNDKILMLDKFTQTPYQKSTQTEILHKETQKYYELQHHDLYPHLYYKIDAISKTLPHNENIVIHNDATSTTVNKNNNINQTSKYIPNSLKEKADNINQTVRYMLKDISPEDEHSGDYTDWYESLNKKQPEVQQPDNNPGLFDWLIGLVSTDPLSNQLDNPSNPSVPSASIQSPSESPPESSNPYIPPSPPSSPSLVAYPASVSSNEEEVENRSRTSRSSKSSKK
jgi:hypothetical protein